ncbi:MAG: type II secretion system protein [Prochloraceae cyanobacterium]|nr:type II secretion system protein [Prochloraceae cyanobacterium]
MRPNNNQSFPFPLWLANFLKNQRTSQKNSDRGFSLLEVLIGMLIISIAVTAITPTLLLGAATRIQNRRAEQAFNIAREQVQQIKILLDNGPTENQTASEWNNQLPPQASITNKDDIKEVNAPGSTCSTNCNADQFLKKGDFLIQTFRNPGVQDGDGRITAFKMGVRVYYISAENQNNLETTKARLTLTSGEGTNLQQFPLAVIYTELSLSDSPDALDEYRTLLER